ncbi:MAG: hypothetical protein JO244_15695 [Solirubrobacterales bacterium]|nr:hypothetical protein [Solirubrobacterales bacterium]
MEQTSMCIGLDHHGKENLILAGEAIAVIGKGIDHAATKCSRIPAEPADTFRDPCWQRPDLTRVTTYVFVNAAHSG